MKKIPNMRTQDLLGLLNRHYPQDLAEDWDNPGLQVGDLTTEIKRVMVALDPTLATLQAAQDQHCQALVTHHPLIFKPLKKISPHDETGRILFTAIRHGISILCAHTNLDRAADGLNDWLAACLALTDCRPLQRASETPWLKLVVYVPQAAADAVAQALFSRGAGEIGNYARCSFRSTGIGTFRPGAGANPHIGRCGTDEQVDEIRLETIVPRHMVSKVVDALHKAHPYEEVAYDLLPLENTATAIGLGRIGSLAAPVSLHEFARQCKQQLDTPGLRVVGDLQKTIRRVAVCGGSGATLIHEAARQGADVLVSGDIKYHEALSAQQLGLAVIDAGHFATEQLMKQQLANRLHQQSQQRSWAVDYIIADNETDPFNMI